MSYRVDPFIPQQAETVAEALRGSVTSNAITGFLRDRDGVWHRLVGLHRRQVGYVAGCGAVVEVGDAVTSLDTAVTCGVCP